MCIVSTLSYNYLKPMFLFHLTKGPFFIPLCFTKVKKNQLPGSYVSSSDCLSVLEH